MTVTVVKLSDSKLSIRLNDEEVAILPKKSECDADDLEKAIQEVMDEAEGGEW